MNFDDYPQLDLSSIDNDSQDDWSCNSEYKQESNLHNWEDNSGLLDEKF